MFLQVNSADFAIAQFRFLKRLLLVHGRWNYRKTSKVLIYSFFKNAVLVMTVVVMGTWTLSSGPAFYEDNCFSMYNMVLTLPIIGVGLFDRDISARTAMRLPEMYVSGRLGLDFNVKRIVSWVFM